MRLEETLLQTAKELGFDNYQVIDTAALHFDERFRMYCETNYCGNYDNNYSCPPACGEQKSWGIRRGRLSGLWFYRLLHR